MWLLHLMWLLKFLPTIPPLMNSSYLPISSLPPTYRLTFPSLPPILSFRELEFEFPSSHEAFPCLYKEALRYPFAPNSKSSCMKELLYSASAHGLVFKEVCILLISHHNLSIFSIAIFIFMWKIMIGFTSLPQPSLFCYSHCSAFCAALIIIFNLYWSS